MTDVSLREHIESNIKWLDRHVAVQIAAIEKATGVALATLNERLAGMNEFRDTLKDQAARLATKDEVAIHGDLIERRISALELGRAEAAGSAKTWGALAGVGGGLVTALILKFLL